MAGSARISPTAHYTGFVWYRHGMSHPAFRTRAGWLLFQLLRPANAAYQAFGGPTLEQMLLARHRIIDHLLEEAIAAGEIGQVVEIAAGLSPRGQRFAARFEELTYVEGDLPAMSERKRRLLADAGLHLPNHHVVEVDALAAGGPSSLAAVGDLLDAGRGTAVITEGLLSYFDRATAEGIVGRIASFLGDYPEGMFLSDLHLRGEVGGLRGARAFQVALSVFARGSVHLHYPDVESCEQALGQLGFDRVILHQARDFASTLDLPESRGAGLVRVIEARVGQRS